MLSAEVIAVPTWICQTSIKPARVKMPSATATNSLPKVVSQNQFLTIDKIGQRAAEKTEDKDRHARATPVRPSRNADPEIS